MWAKANGHQTRAIKVYAGEPFHSAEEFDWLIALGGPMNVCQEAAFPFLKGEKLFIERALRAGKMVQGIVLSQLIADVLGCKSCQKRPRRDRLVSRRVNSGSGGCENLFRFARAFTTFHWHGEMFEIPTGAQRMAHSAACQNQAFVYGENVCGVQFHPEVTKEICV